MSHIKKVGLGVLGILILASIIGGFALLGSEAYRMFTSGSEIWRSMLADNEYDLL